MPTFDDFNFGDDAPTVDTDPAPDNPDPQPADNKQDDVLNYPEPGENDAFEGGHPTAADVQGNPNEPGAQVDHIPPLSQINEAWLNYILTGKVDQRQLADSDNPWLNYILTGQTHPDMLSSSEQQWLDIFLSKEHKLSPTEQQWLDVFVAGRDRALEAEQDWVNYILTGQVSPGQMSEYEQDWYDYIVTGKIPPSLSETALGRRNSVMVDDDVITPQEYPGIIIEDTNAAEEIKFGYLLDSVSSLMLIPDTIIDALFDDQSMIALIEEYNNGEASWGTIDGLDDFANPIDNPSGVGELFDQLLVSGHDAFVSIDNAQDIEGLVSSDFLSLDQYQEEIDTRDYIGDLTLNSDIIEFQNMGQNVLEDFDGVL